MYACDHLTELKKLGENAMNEVYLSWEDAVKNAYQRYFTVIDNCKRGITQKKETKAQEILFSSVSDITNSIQKVRSITASTKAISKRFSHKVIKTGKTITSSITTNIKELAEKIENNPK